MLRGSAKAGQHRPQAVHRQEGQAGAWCGHLPYSISWRLPWYVWHLLPVLYMAPPSLSLIIFPCVEDNRASDAPGHCCSAAPAAGAAGRVGQQHTAYGRGLAVHIR